MNTIANNANGIAIGGMRALDVETLLAIYGSAVKSDGMVSIDADTLRKMTEELILVKSGQGTPIIPRSNIRQGNPGYVSLSENIPRAI